MPERVTSGVSRARNRPRPIWGTSASEHTHNRNTQNASRDNVRVGLALAPWPALDDVATQRKFALQTIIQSALESTLITLQQVQQFMGLHHDEMTLVVKVDWEHVAVSKGCHVCGHQMLEDRHGGGLRTISGLQAQKA